MNDELNFMFSYHGLRTLDCYDSEFITKQFFRHLTGLLGRGIGIYVFTDIIFHIEVGTVQSLKHNLSLGFVSQIH